MGRGFFLGRAQQFFSRCTAEVDGALSPAPVNHYQSSESGGLRTNLSMTKCFQTQSCAERAVRPWMQWPRFIQKILLTSLIWGLFASIDIRGIVLLFTGWPWTLSRAQMSPLPLEYWHYRHTVTARLLGLFQEQEALNMLMIQIFWKSNMYLCKETGSWLQEGRGDLCVIVWWGVWTSPSPEQREHQKCGCAVPPHLCYSQSCRSLQHIQQDSQEPLWRVFGILCITWNILKM